MDKIALIADIHGNIPALEAVLRDIQKRGITRIYCLGDIVGKGPYPAEAVDICRDVCEKVVMGNWDISIANENLLFPFPKKLRFHADWHRRKLGAERLDYLENLPGAIDVYISGKKVRLFHASQKGVYHRVSMNDPVEKQLAMFENTDFTGYQFEPDVIGYGDIHVPYQRNFAEKILFNIGSVGNPLDIPQASYQIMEGIFGGKQKAPFSLQLVRLEYDRELAVQQAKEAEMPDLEAYEIELRTAKYMGHASVVSRKQLYNQKSCLKLFGQTYARQKVWGQSWLQSGILQWP